MIYIQRLSKIKKVYFNYEEVCQLIYEDLKKAYDLIKKQYSTKVSLPSGSSEVTIIQVQAYREQLHKGARGLPKNLKKYETYLHLLISPEGKCIIKA